MSLTHLPPSIADPPPLPRNEADIPAPALDQVGSKPPRTQPYFAQSREKRKAPANHFGGLPPGKSMATLGPTGILQRSLVISTTLSCAQNTKNCGLALQRFTEHTPGLNKSRTFFVIKPKYISRFSDPTKPETVTTNNDRNPRIVISAVAASRSRIIWIYF